MALAKTCSSVAARPVASPAYVEALKLRNYAGFVGLVTRNIAEAGETRDADGRGVAHWCAEYNCCDELMYCLENSIADPNQVDEDGWTPLHVAVAHNHHQCVDLLLRSGSDPYLTVAGSGNNCLHIAVARGHLQALALILKVMDKIEHPNSAGLSPLAVAVMAQQSLTTKALLEAGADPRTRVPGTDETMLHVAVGNQDIETCRILLENVPELALIPDNRGMRCADIPDPIFKHLCQTYLPSNS